ncbi:MAG: hypothetical protein KKD94_02570 [Nanoarchaeota archaeon]|nr:hypothetical protein [Nanoarchaeota archaeon]
MYKKSVTMNKQAKLALKSFIVLGLLAVVFYISFGFAAHVVTSDGYNTSLYGPVLEDIGYTYNITINNSDNTYESNITKVNITLPTGFVFRPGPLFHNGTSLGVGNYTFTSTGNISLVWENASSMLFNGSAAGTLKNFWFNATVQHPGWYNITVETTYNGTGTRWANISVVVNDTTTPNLTTINVPSPWSNVSGTITLNATITDNGAMSAVHFNITNATGVGTGGVHQNFTIAATNIGNDWYITFDTGELTDGVHNITVWANDTYNNLNITSSVTIIVNNTLPVLSYGTSSENDGTNFSRDWIYANMSFTQNSSAVNITFTLHNQTAKLNETVFNKTYLYRTWMNWTSLTESNYTYNLTVTDYTNARITTATRALVLDTTNPALTLARSSSSTQTQIVMTSAITEGGSRVASACGVDGFSAEFVTVTGMTPNSGTQTLTVTGLSCGTSYNFIVSCTDNAGNTGSSASTAYSTEACGGGSSGGGGGSGGGGTTWSATYNEADEVLSNKEEGVTRTLAKQHRVKLSVSGGTGERAETHYVGITSLGADSATVEVTSTPQEATLKIGESKKFEVTDDGFYDLVVTLNSITNNKADITIKSIYEAVTGAQPEPETEQEGEEVAQLAEEETGPQLSSSNARVWMVVIVIIVIVVVVLWFVLGKNKGKKKKIKGKFY